MKLSVYGVGYVGLVSAVCFAKLGHEVCCYDIDSDKIKMLQEGHPPICEDKLKGLLGEAIEQQRIQFSDDFNAVANYSLLHIIAVGTPSLPNGCADISHVHDVATKLSETLSADYHIIVNKSTVPVGTAAQVHELLSRNGFDCDVVSNPEFLREGKAVHDFMHPHRIIVGSNSKPAIELLRALYKPLIDQKIPFVLMEPASAELTKYASNAFLATKISFMNMLSQYAEALNKNNTDVNISKVIEGMSHDPRIGSDFLNSGCGYGGSCLPKDTLALSNSMEQEGCQTFLDAVQQINEDQKKLLFKKILHCFDADLSKRCIALWGLAFKPGTDDIREAPSICLMELLWEAGASVQAYDPLAMDRVKERYKKKENLSLQLCNSRESALEGADVLAIVTEWSEFLTPNFAKIKATLRHPVIFDGRNLYNPEEPAKYGLRYYGIGLPLTDPLTSLTDYC